jgi:protein-L-isoaspartate(D-aspartate) O-methyltransferase
MNRHTRLLAEIRADVQLTANLTGREALSERVMEAMANVPRHEFVTESYQFESYRNSPLPIGHGQTISQPFIVALMTDLLNTAPDHVILEIGTGSGYQAAVLADLVEHVYSVEIVEPLVLTARKTLSRLGYHNVTIQHGDGYHGWVQHAPFDGIIVTANCEEIPSALVEQLKPSAKLVLPVGAHYGPQRLVVVSKDESGEVTTGDVLSVAFVPLTGDH